MIKKKRKKNTKVKSWTIFNFPFRNVCYPRHLLHKTRSLLAYPTGTGCHSFSFLLLKSISLFDCVPCRDMILKRTFIGLVTISLTETDWVRDLSFFFFFYIFSKRESIFYLRFFRSKTLIHLLCGINTISNNIYLTPEGS